ncbi:lytic transglycosylase domain-containing protein [Patescibacteria group bacterium]
MKRLFNELSAKFKLSKRRKNKMARLFKETLIALAIIGFVAPVSIYGQAEAEARNSEPYNVKINTASGQLVSLQLTNPKVKVVPGESNHDKALRLKREAEARNRVRITYSTPSAPANLSALYKKAGARYRVPWQILSAVHFVETGRSQNTGRCSYAGACGPMQFMPATWRAYGVDGNGDGVRDITNVVDAMYGAANYLAANGANRGAYTAALYRYNHSTTYVNKVLGIARSLGL